MPNAIGGGVTLRNVLDSVQVTMYINESTVDEDIIDQPVSLDTSADNTVKLIEADEEVFGVIKAVEDRVVEGIKVVTVAIAGGAFTLPYVTGDSVAIGDCVVGSSTAGKLKRVASPAAKNRTRVVAKDATNETVDVIMI